MIATPELTLAESQAIAESIIGRVQWNGAEAFLECPGRASHTTADHVTDCKFVCQPIGTLAPGVYCYHSSCAPVRDALNYILRRRLWDATHPEENGGEGAIGKAARRASPGKRKAKSIVTAEQAIARVEQWLDGFRCDAADLWHQSPWRPLEDWRCDSLMLLAGLYAQTDLINIVTDFTAATKDGETKANPSGAGVTKLRDDWMRHIRDHGNPQSEAGAWMRPNPCKETGSGHKGAICDADITSFRFLLIESDKLPEDLALSFYSCLPLPVVALIASGGRGPHAWVRLDCATAEDYRARVDRIFARLVPMGIDSSNGNPSRLSRLPGALRGIGAKGRGEQRLYYLNPDADGQPIFARKGALLA